MAKNELKRSAATEDKPYKMTIEQRPEYLYVYVSGKQDSYAISHQYWTEVAEHCRKLKCKKLLIEEDIEQVISMAEVYQLASELPQMGFLGVRAAFVDRYAEHQDLNEFGGLVAVNRGLYGKIFADFETAEKWLLSK